MAVYIPRIACKTTRRCKNVEPAELQYKRDGNLDSDGTTMHAPFAAFWIVPCSSYRETPADTTCFCNGPVIFFFPGILPSPAEPATAAVTLLVPLCSGLSGQ